MRRGQVAIARLCAASRNQRGQVATEFLIIIGLVLVVFIPLLMFVYFKTNEANAQIGEYQAELAALRLAYLANSVGALGSSTSLVAEVYIPPGVSNFSTRSVQRGGEVVLIMNTPSGPSEVVEVVKYPIANPQELQSQQGWARFTITSVYNSTGGQATIRIDRS
jgi:uncharacterized protein (UPF0333 family)